MTTLSRQLKKLAVPQTQIYRPNFKRASFLFDPNEAAGFDKETFYSIGRNGFEELLTIDENFQQFEKNLFSESSVGVQRAVLSKDANQTLDSSIDKFLLLLTPYFPLKAAHKTLEWLIYRFNIHQYNIDAVMRCILLYHDTNLFVRMVQILDIQEQNVLWYWLMPIRKPGVHLSRQTLLNHCSTNLGFLNYLADSVNGAIDILNEKELQSVQILFTFYASIVCGTISICEDISESFVGQLLPNIVLGLKSTVYSYTVAAYMILTQLALKLKLKSDVCKILIKEILMNLRPTTALAGLSACLVLYQTQVVDFLDSKTVYKLAVKHKQSKLIDKLEILNESSNLKELLVAIFRPVFDTVQIEIQINIICKFLQKLISSLTLDSLSSKAILECLMVKYIELAAKDKDPNELQRFVKKFGDICKLLCRRYPVVLDLLLDEKFANDKNTKEKFLEMCDASTFMPSQSIEEKSSVENFLSTLNSFNPHVRHVTVTKILEYVSSESCKEEEKPRIAIALLKCFDDAEFGILKLLITNFSLIVKVCTFNGTCAKIRQLLERPEPEEQPKRWRKLVSLVLNTMCSYLSERISMEDLSKYTTWWPIDGSCESLNNLLLVFEMLSIGCDTKHNVKEEFLEKMKTFVDFQSSKGRNLFHLVVVCSNNPKWHHLLLPMLNLIRILLQSAPENHFEEYLSKDSLVLPCLSIALFSVKSVDHRTLVCNCWKTIFERHLKSSTFYYLDFIEFVYNHMEEIRKDSSQLLQVFLNYYNSNVVSATPKRTRKSDKLATNISPKECLLNLYELFLNVDSDSDSSLEICTHGLELFQLIQNPDFLLAASNGVEKIFSNATNLNEEKWSKFFKLVFDQYSTNTSCDLTVKKTPYLLLQKVLSVKFDYAFVTVAALKKITNTFYANLKESIAAEVFDLLIEMCMNCPLEKVDTVGRCAKTVLINIPISANFLVKFLETKVFVAKSCTSVVSSPIKAKRRRTTISSQETQPTELTEQSQLPPDKLALLTFVLELFLANENIEKKEILLKLFFKSVRSYLSEENKSIADYGLQITLNCIELICKGDESSKISSNNFDVELLVQCIRTAESPITHKHAFTLLTVAVDLFKEDLVVRLMPIFSFMGKNLFRQDDNYSFQVISRTIETIMPSLIASSNQSKLDEVVLKIYRDFALSAAHIPEHRRMTVLSKIVQASGSRQNLHNTSESSVSEVKCKYLWYLIGLLIEYHVTHWNKEQPSPELSNFRNSGQDKNALHSNIEFCLRLCSEFSIVDQIYCASSLMKYILKLPDNITEDSSFALPINPTIFELKNHTDKQLRHFKHEVLVFVANLLTHWAFVTKIAEIETSELCKISPVCEDLQMECVTCWRHCGRMLENSSNDILKKFWKTMLYRSKACNDKLNALLPAEMSLHIIDLLLQRDSIEIKQHSLEILNQKLLQNPTPFTAQHIPNLLEISKRIIDWFDEDFSSSRENVMLIQSSFYTLKLLTRVVGSKYPDCFLEALTKIVALLHDWKNANKLLLSNAVLCLADLITTLHIATIQHLPSFVRDLLDVMAYEIDSCENELLIVSCLTCIQKILESLSQFLSPYVSDLLRTIGSQRLELAIGAQYKTQTQHRINSIKKQMSILPMRVLLPALEKSLNLKNEHTLTHWHFTWDLLCDHLNQSISEEIVDNLNIFTDLFTNSLDLRVKLANKSTDKITPYEDAVMNALMKLSLKLSETNFRPFLEYLLEWSKKDSKKSERLIVLYRFANKLADHFRSLFNLFASGFLKLASELLTELKFSKDSRFSGEHSQENTNLLLCSIFDLITKCCNYDTGGFVSRDRFDSLMQPIVKQLEECGSYTQYRTRMDEHLLPCVIALAGAINDDSAWKLLNNEIMLKTRHKKPVVRVCALKVVEKLYAKLGESISTLVPESVPFLAELMEDESEDVEKQCQAVMVVLETIVGESLKDYF